MNWKRLSRWCLVGALVMLVWLLVPAAKCTGRGMHETQIGGIDESQEEASDTDTGRVREGEGFLGRFFGNIGVCYDLHPVTGQDEWKQQLAAGFVGGFVLFWVIGYLTKPRYR